MICAEYTRLMEQSRAMQVEADEHQEIAMTAFNEGRMADATLSFARQELAQAEADQLAQEAAWAQYRFERGLS